MATEVIETVFKASGLNNFQKAFAQAESAVNKFESAGQKLGNFGSSMTRKLTIPIVGAGAAVIKLGADFDDQMSTIQAVTKASTKEMEQMTAKARDLGKNTRYSAREVAEAQENLARAGFNTTEILNSLEDTLNLATAGNISLAQASDITASTIRGFGLDASDAERVADTLAYTASATKTNVDGLGESFAMVAPVAASLDMSMEETAAAIGILGDNAIEGSQAGNMLKRGLLNLSAPTKQQNELMQSLGMEFFDSNGQMKSMQDIVAELEVGLDGMSDKQRTAALSTLFGSQAVAGFAALVNTGSDELGRLQGEIVGADGYAQDFAETAEDNLAGAFRGLKSSLEELSLSFYEMGRGPVTDLINWFTKLIDSFSESSDETKQWIIVIAGVAAAIGPAASMVSFLMGTIVKIITPIISLIGWFKKVGGIVGAVTAAKGKLAAAIAFLTNPITLVIAGVAALVAGLVYLYNTNETARNVINNAWNAISDVISAVIERVDNLIRFVWSTLVNFWEENNELILSIAENVWREIESVIQIFMDYILPFLIEGWSVIAETIGVVWDLISNLIATALNFILGIIQATMQLIDGDWTAAWETIKETFENLWLGILFAIEEFLHQMFEIITEIMTNIGEKISEIWEGIKEYFTEVFESIYETVSEKVIEIYESITEWFGLIPEKTREIWEDVKEGVTEWVENMLEKAVELGTEFIETITEFFEDLPYKMGFWLGETLANVYLWATAMWEQAKETGSNFIESTKEYFSTLPGRVWEYLTDTYERTKTWGLNTWNKAKETGSNFLTAISEWFSQLPGRISNWLSQTWENTKSWAVNTWNKATEAGRNFINNLINWVQQLPGRVQTWLTNTITRLTTWVRNMGNKGKDAGKDLTDKAVNGVKGLPKKMASAGKDVVRGFWDGITGLGSWLSGKVTGFFSGIVDGAKSALKIFSPSRVFRDDVGEMVVRGFGVGVEKNEKKAMNPMKDMIDNVVGLATGANAPVIDIAGTLARSNADVKSVVAHEFGDTDTEKQPAYITLVLGGREFSVFVDDITDLQDKNENLELSYLGG